MNYDILNPQKSYVELNLLTDYFRFNYKCDASYYNPYSLILFVSKLSRKYPEKAPFEIALFRKSVVALVSKDRQMVHLMGAKDKDESMMIIKQLISNRTLKVALHFPDFTPESNWKVVKTYNQLLVPCETFFIEDGLSRVGPLTGLNQRSISTLKKNYRELTTFRIDKHHSEDLQKILGIWSSTAKERGVYSDGIEKDRICFDLIENDFPNLFGWISYRKDFPVAYNIVTTLPKNITCAVLIASKSLNYKKQPGGYNETSAYSMIRLLDELYKNGVHSLNLSGGSNKHSSLDAFKKKFGGSTVKVHDYSI